MKTSENIHNMSLFPDVEPKIAEPIPWDDTTSYSPLRRTTQAIFHVILLSYPIQN
jgi:hypothetical protein